MKYLKLNIAEAITYPVGKFIEYNIPVIRIMAIKLEKLFQGDTLVLWCSGSSGAIISAIVSSNLKNKVFINHIKKSGEYSHDYGDYITNPNYRHIVIDDFISSGETIRFIYRTMCSNLIESADCVCVTGSVSKTQINNCITTKYLICNKLNIWKKRALI